MNFILIEQNNNNVIENGVMKYLAWFFFQLKVRHQKRDKPQENGTKKPKISRKMFKNPDKRKNTKKSAGSDVIQSFIQWFISFKEFKLIKFHVN